MQNLCLELRVCGIHMYVTKGDEHVGSCFGGVGILIITIKEKVNNKRVLSHGFEE